MDLKIDGFNIYNDADGHLISVTVQVMRDEYRTNAKTYVEIPYSDGLTIKQIQEMAISTAKEKLKAIAGVL